MNGRDADRRGARDVASVLPFLTVVLLLPPVILIFAAPVSIAGIPLIILYLFCAWGGIILCAFLVARHLAHIADGTGDEGGDGDPPDPAAGGQR
ncbi:hypothetical protein HW532_13790 [Kaustia mangrovi]|uniref:DUF3311 domain-containing protein n=1 Tax=Kaustia mangrovi TaxID=2593653 RepID=A0A7S8HCV8_9HYPH|nr:hypothetical protein [Kaustia mangrovi]QPC43663.1 hypothetical protein HW532_13790 [Kaustia mangrovi]